MPSFADRRLKAVQEAEHSKGRSHQVIVTPASVAAFFLQHVLEVGSLPSMTSLGEGRANYDVVMCVLC